MSRQDEPFEPDPVVEAYKRDVDRTLIRENLRLSVEERFERLMRLQEFAEELRRAGRERESQPCEILDCYFGGKSMRVNVYAEEIPIERRTELVVKTAGTGVEFRGIRIFLQSAPALHDTETDDDRSAITFYGDPKTVAAILREAADKFEG